jgi:hypothetical protein
MMVPISGGPNLSAGAETILGKVAEWRAECGH